MRYLIIILLILFNCSEDILFNTQIEEKETEKEDYIIKFSSIDIHLIILNSSKSTYSEKSCSLNTDMVYIIGDTSFVRSVIVRKVFIYYNKHMPEHPNPFKNLIFGIEADSNIIYFDYDSIYYDKDCKIWVNVKKLKLFVKNLDIIPF